MTPSCPSSLLQFQHGVLTLTAPAEAAAGAAAAPTTNTTLTLTPLAHDGRQLSSAPCAYATAVLTRLDAAAVIFSAYVVSTDAYNGRGRLDTWAWDGTSLPPLWAHAAGLVMLPTGELHAGSNAKAGVKRRAAAAGLWRGEARSATLAGRVRVGAASTWCWGGLGALVAGLGLWLCG